MLEELNPWWRREDWEDLDFDLRRLKSLKITWVPDWIKKISLAPFSLNFVYGPRQVGKTTGIKLLISELIDKGEEASSIVYVNCDLLASFRELRNLLKRLAGFKFIFLDEVTSIEYWWKVLKGYIDMGLFKDSVITVSGSSSVKARKFIESFSGRRGKGREIVVLPLSFPEFARVLGYRKRELGEALKAYLELGGFPRSINKDPTFLEDFVKSVEREIARVGKSYRIAREVLFQVMLKAPSPMSYASIAKQLGVSHITVREYLELMEELFILKIAYHKEGKRINFRKEKKVFFRDPFMLRAFSFWTGVEFLKSALYENIVQEHLYRRFGEIYYYRNKYEIDCIAGELKIEVKAGKPHRKYPKGVIILDEAELPMFLLKLFLPSQSRWALHLNFF